MGNKSKKTQQNRNLKQANMVPKKRIFLVPFYFILLFLIVFISAFFVTKTVSHSTFYKNYVVFLEKTKVVLYPGVHQKDQKTNLNEWLVFNKRFMNHYQRDLSFLSPTYDLIEKNVKKESWEEARDRVEDFRVEMLKVMKGKKYYSQTIMVEDLLSLVLDMEKAIDQKDSAKIMDLYQDFNSKFTFVIPVMIKTDVLKIGEIMDQIYKKTLFQTTEGTMQIYQELKKVFVTSYRDYQSK